MTATRALVHPAAILAIAVLVLNDHVLKARFGGWWTGKLSDLAGLAVFPLLIVAAAERLGGLRVGRRAVVAAAAATALGFAAIKLSPAAGEIYRVGLAVLQWPFRAAAAFTHGDALPALGRVHLTPDPTDLFAVPFVLVSVWLIWRSEPGGRGRPACRAAAPSPSCSP